MKSAKTILIAFLLNLAFSFLEAAGGIFTGSTAILSDAFHDFGDAVSIGLAYFWEKKSRRAPDEIYTYGYLRYSVLGGAATTLILLVGSAAMFFHAVYRLFHPLEIRYDGMLLLALIGVSVNLIAAFVTSEKGSFNRKAVNLHMLEDVLGWAVVLVGAAVMRFTDSTWIDPLLSAGTSVFIFLHAARHMKEILGIFLERTPTDLNVQEITEHLKEIEGVLDVHHLHIWSLDGHHHCATVHIVSTRDIIASKEAIREGLREHGIDHVTIETENENESCRLKYCTAEPQETFAHHHHH